MRRRRPHAAAEQRATANVPRGPRLRGLQSESNIHMLARARARSVDDGSRDVLAFVCVRTPSSREPRARIADGAHAHARAEFRSAHCAHVYDT